jgi:hypothetical protein
VRPDLAGMDIIFLGLLCVLGAILTAILCDGLIGGFWGTVTSSLTTGGFVWRAWGR